MAKTSEKKTEKWHNRQALRKCFDGGTCLDAPRTIPVKYGDGFCQQFRRGVPKWWETFAHFSG